MTDTSNESTAATAAAEALRREFYDGVGTGEFADAGRVAAAAAEPHHQVAAYDEAHDALGHLAGFHEGALSEDWIDGVNTARKLIGEQRDAIAAELDTAEDRCPECGGLGGGHSPVHERHATGGGGVNRPCPRTEGGAQ